MLAVCMGPLEKHCSELRAIWQQICNVENATNSHCVCHELKSINSEANIGDAISQQVISVEGMPGCNYFEMEDIIKFNPENYGLKLLHLNI